VVVVEHQEVEVRVDTELLLELLVEELLPKVYCR
jgi:hypothetical protein